MTVGWASASIEGAGQTALVEALKAEMGVPYFQNDHTVALAREKYYMRIDGYLMRVVILDFTSPSRCNVRVLAGGAGEGILDIGWRAETDDVTETINKLYQVCTANGWQFARTE